MAGRLDRATLLLNASAQPLSVISAFDAICLVIEGKAVIVAEVEGESIRSQREEWPMPSVISLTSYVHIPYGVTAPLNTKSVLSRDRHTCAYCGGSACEMDHIIPRSRGGRHHWMNVIASCRECNATKADHLLEEIGWSLSFEPTMPPDHYWLVVGWREREQWKEWIEAVPIFEMV